MRFGSCSGRSLTPAVTLTVCLEGREKCSPGPNKEGGKGKKATLPRLPLALLAPFSSSTYSHLHQSFAYHLDQHRSCILSALVVDVLFPLLQVGREEKTHTNKRPPLVDTLPDLIRCHHTRPLLQPFHITSTRSWLRSTSLRPRQHRPRLQHQQSPSPRHHPPTLSLRPFLPLFNPLRPQSPNTR